MGMKTEKLYTRNIENKVYSSNRAWDNSFWITYMVFPSDIEEIFPISTRNEPEKAIFIRTVLEIKLTTLL